MIGVAWPFVRDTFQLSQSAVSLVFMGAGFSYFLSSFFTGQLLHRLGIGSLLAVSSLLVAACCAGYGGAPAWPWFVAGSLLHGLGSGAIDAGLNHYAASHFSARSMNWLHGCYSLGATLGPFIVTRVLAAQLSWRAGYFIVAGVLFSLALLFVVTRRRWDDPGSASGVDLSEEEKAPTFTVLQTLRFRPAAMQIALFFFYTGLEVTVGQWSFTVLVEARNVARESAGDWVTLYWGCLCAGRFLLGAVVEHVGLDRLLRLSIATALGGIVLFAANLGDGYSAVGLGLTGLGLAPIYPCMMSKTPLRLGKARSAHAIGLQVSSAMLGVSILPSLSGLLAQRVGLHLVPFAALGMALAVFACHEALLGGDRARARRLA